MKLNKRKSHIKTSQIVSTLVVVYLVLCLVSDFFQNPEYHWDVVGKYLFYPRVLEGLGWTLILTFGSMAFGVALSIVLALLQKGENRVLRIVAKSYIWFFRGTPIYTQLVFWGLITVIWPQIKFGIPFTQIEFFHITTEQIYNVALVAIVGLALNEAAYLSEIVRAGIESVPKGQFEAGISLGLTKNQTMFRIILPQAMKVIIPPTGNETISMLKTTSLVLAVPFTMDINYIQGAIASRLFLPIPLLLVACFWYLAITSVLMLIQAQIEKRLGKGIISVG
jgi:polar amino acid transport system permease protein